jgi:hypothetical protein
MIKKEKTEQEPDNKNVIEKIQEPRDRKQFLKNYYKNNEEKIIDQIKNNENDENYYIRLVREINNGLIDFKTVRASTIEKYKT